MAAAACSTMISKLEPPVWVASVQLAWTPRYSASSTEGMKSPPVHEATPSTSAMVSPASSSASLITAISMARGVPSISPVGDTMSAAPTMAAEPRAH